MNKTAIEWTDFSASPIKFRDTEGRAAWGCIKASAGCQNCYAEAISRRYRRHLWPHVARVIAEVGAKRAEMNATKHGMSLHHAVGAWDTEKARIATGLEDGAE